jgi:hypothetical protein
MQNQKPGRQIVILDLEFAQAVVNYLQTKPFGEVAGFISVFAQSQAQPAPEENETVRPLASAARARAAGNGSEEPREVKAR